MKNYLMTTTTTMKPHNCRKWWIDSKIIPEIEVEAETKTEAFCKYAEIVASKHYVDISKSAIKNRRPMYIDTKSGTKQVGCVLTGACDLEDDNYNWTRQYIDLWVNVKVFDHA